MALADELKIVNHIRETGADGVHIDALLKKCDVPLKLKKDFLNRLYEMQNHGKIERLPGNKWSAPVVPAVSDTPMRENGNSANSVNNQGGGRPKINLPGMGTFTSFKNSLQEYTQKMKSTLVYTSEKVGEQVFATASFQSTNVRSSIGHKTEKDAECQAALDALKQLGYVASDVVYTPPQGNRKRKSKSGKDAGESVSKVPAVVDGDGDVSMAAGGPNEANKTTYKSMLQILSQKNKLEAPTYETIQHPNGFFSTVTFNGKQFKSANFERQKKQAEQSAAHMCLYLINVVPEVPTGYTPGPEDKQFDDVKKTIAALRFQSENKPNPGKSSPKNKLQEYCQKLGSAVPVYQTTLRADKTAISTVTANGVNFTGDACASKKKAETSAAVIACGALNIEVPAPDV